MSVKWANGAVEWEASYRPFGELAKPVLPGGEDLIRTHSCGPHPEGGSSFADAASAGFIVYNADGTTRVTTCSAGCIVGTVEDAQALNRVLDGDPNSILYVTAGSGWISWRDAPM